MVRSSERYRQNLGVIKGLVVPPISYMVIYIWFINRYYRYITYKLVIKAHRYYRYITYKLVINAHRYYRYITYKLVIKAQRYYRYITIYHDKL